MTMWVWEKGFENQFLCDTCIHDDPNTHCCGAGDCFGGDHYENQNTLFMQQEEQDE